MSFKSDFPIFTHNPDLVYFDSAATTQKPQVVLDAIMDFYQNYNANIHRGIYPIAEKATAKVEEVREKVREFINARYKEEIIFTKSTTEGINLIAQSWGRENIRKGDEIIVPLSEHHANFVPWQQLAKEKRAVFTTLNSVDSLRKLKLQKTKLIALSHISNVLGTVKPVPEITKEVKAINSYTKVLVDAAQSVVHTRVDVQDMDCDFLAFSGHKMFAETGVGILYVKKEILETMPPFLYGGDMIKEVEVEKTTFADIPQRHEAGTLNISGIISLGAAIDYIEKVGITTIQEHEHQLTEYCLKELKKVGGITILGQENDKERSGIISFTMDGVHPHDIAHILGEDNICIRAGHHCAMPLHTFLGIPASSRVSFSLYNTDEDGEKFIWGIKKVQRIFQ